MQNNICARAMISSFVILSPAVLAGGFQTQEKSAHGLGRAYAGEAAIGDDASSLASNPAAMSRLKKAEFSLSLARTDAKATIKVEDAYIKVPALQVLGLGLIKTAGESRDSGSTTDRIVPAIYAVYPLDAQYSLGIGVYSDFASETNYGSNFSGRILAGKTKLDSFEINPSAAFKISPKLALGAGLRAVRADAELSASIPALSPLKRDGFNVLNPQTGELIIVPNGASLGSETVTTQAWGFGWNVGLLVDLADSSRIGLAYRSTVDLKLEGDASFSEVPALDMFTDYTALVPIQLPEKLSVSIVQSLGENLQLSADMTKTRWRNFEYLKVLRKIDGVVTSKTEERWQDARRYSIGMDYALAPSLSLRTGLAYDSSPIADEHRSLRIPTDDMRIYCLGGTYRISEKSKIDLAYSHFRQSEATINDSRDFVEQKFQAKLIASSRLEASILATQFSFTL